MHLTKYLILCTSQALRVQALSISRGHFAGPLDVFDTKEWKDFYEGDAFQTKAQAAVEYILKYQNSAKVDVQWDCRNQKYAENQKDKEWNYSFQGQHLRVKEPCNAFSGLAMYGLKNELRKMFPDNRYDLGSLAFAFGSFFLHAGGSCSKRDDSGEHGAYWAGKSYEVTSGWMPGALDMIGQSLLLARLVHEFEGDTKLEVKDGQSFDITAANLQFWEKKTWALMDSFSSADEADVDFEKLIRQIPSIYLLALAAISHSSVLCSGNALVMPVRLLLDSTTDSVVSLSPRHARQIGGYDPAACSQWLNTVGLLCDTFSYQEDLFKGWQHGLMEICATLCKTSTTQLSEEYASPDDDEETTNDFRRVHVERKMDQLTKFCAKSPPTGQDYVTKYSCSDSPHSQFHLKLVSFLSNSARVVQLFSDLR